jgi:hypothetical protein
MSDWTVYAVTSTKYGVFNANDVCRRVAANIDNRMRGEVTYDPETTRLSFEAFHHADKVVDLASADVFKAGLKGSSADDGTGSISLWAAFFRNLCLNLIIIDKGKMPLLRIVHRGSMTSVPYKIRQANAQVNRMWAPFAERWGAARQTETTKTLAEEIKSLVATSDLRDKSGIQRDALVEALLQNVQLEGKAVDEVGSLADVVNAVTRLHSRVTATARPKVENFAWGLLQ